VVQLLLYLMSKGFSVARTRCCDFFFNQWFLYIDIITAHKYDAAGILDGMVVVTSTYLCKGRTFAGYGRVQRIDRTY